jgi:hypothetical protein
MTLIELYVEEVQRNLPRKLRDDIGAEIQSSLEDTLEDRIGSEDAAHSEDLVVEILKERGSPVEVARSYLPTRYLIGPRLYPIFILVIKIILVVMVIPQLITMISPLSGTAIANGNVMDVLSKAVINYFITALQAFGNIVFIFAVLERVLPGDAFDETDQPDEWDPHSLAKLEKQDRVTTPGILWEIGITLAWIVLFNFYPQWVGAANFRDGSWVFIPLLGTAFQAFLPWLNLRFFLGIILNSVLLRQGHRTKPTRWAALGLHLFSLIILVGMLTGGPILGLNPAHVAYHGQTVESLTEIMKIFDWFPLSRLEAFLFIILIVTTGAAALKLFLKIFRTSPLTINLKDMK